MTEVVGLFFPITMLLGAIALGAISPGPSFVLVARIAVAASRLEGLMAAVGMGLGAGIFAIVVMLGHEISLAGVPWLLPGLKMAGACYLICLAIGLWRGASQPLVDGDSAAPAPGSAGKALIHALLTQLSNPKAVVFYGSVFAALLPKDLPRPVALMLPGLVFVVEAGWYAIVALALSSVAPRRVYFRFKTGLDRVAGCVLGLLGLKLFAAVANT